MNGWQFIEAMGWGSLIFAIWLLLLHELKPGPETWAAIVFFFVVATWATRKREAYDEKESER